jgi:hypothetical protein
MASKNIDLAVQIPFSAFFEWATVFAPELSHDAVLKEIRVIPEREELIVRAKTDRAHYNEYKRRADATKPK